MNLLGLLFVAAGVFSMCGAVLDWDWFMTGRRARFMVAILTRTGARIFYAIVGLGLVVFGILLAAGVIQQTE